MRVKIPVLVRRIGTYQFEPQNVRGSTSTNPSNPLNRIQVTLFNETHFAGVKRRSRPSSKSNIARYLSETFLIWGHRFRHSRSLARYVPSYFLLVTI